jgi:hypothetical protein
VSERSAAINQGERRDVSPPVGEPATTPLIRTVQKKEGSSADLADVTSETLIRVATSQNLRTERD